MAKNLRAVMKGEMSYYKMRHPQTMIKLIVESGLRKLFQDYNFALASTYNKMRKLKSHKVCLIF